MPAHRLIAYLGAVRRVAPPAAVAVVSSLETPLAPLWVWLAFNETPTLNTLVGGAFILVAVVGQMFAEHAAGRRAA
jgi:drug/metabolite transporter (DMT)-like permease